MSTRSALRKVTRYQPCAEPDCPIEVGPRHASTAFLYLHCDEHRFSNTGVMRDGLPTSDRWTRMTCAHCGALYEKYTTSVSNNTTGTFFCSKSCRGAKGTKPRRGEVRMCELDGCEEEFYVRSASARRFHSAQCRDIASRTRVYLTFTCKFCNEPFQVAESQARWNKNDACSPDHARKLRSYKVGDKKLSADGYIMVLQPDHCMAQPKTGWVLEHRMIVSDLLGRPLKPTEDVHHRSGRKDINTPDQLVLMAKSHPAGAGIRDTIDWCRKFIEEYEPVARQLEKAGVHTTLDEDDNVVALFARNGSIREVEGA